jgi:hypothetical protein
MSLRAAVGVVYSLYVLAYLGLFLLIFRALAPKPSTLLIEHPARSKPSLSAALLTLFCLALVFENSRYVLGAIAGPQASIAQQGVLWALASLSVFAHMVLTPWTCVILSGLWDLWVRPSKAILLLSTIFSLSFSIWGLERLIRETRLTASTEYGVFLYRPPKEFLSLIPILLVSLMALALGIFLWKKFGFWQLCVLQLISIVGNGAAPNHPLTRLLLLNAFEVVFFFSLILTYRGS